MNDFLLSAFFGLIIFVEMLAAYFGWQFVRRTCFFGWIIGLALTVAMYRLAVSMTTEATLFLGVTNTPVIKDVLIAPIIISVGTSIITAKLERYKKRRRYNSSCF